MEQATFDEALEQHYRAETSTFRLIKRLTCLITMLCFCLSTILSILFWWSIGAKLAESILFVSFALVFELCKFISLPLAIRNYSQKGLVSLHITTYTVLTILSILSSIGGIRSCLEFNAQQAIQTSGEYKTISNQINTEQGLINTELKAIQSSLANNYRTQALTIQSKIPEQQAVLEQLRQQRDQANTRALPPALSLLNMFSNNLSVSFENIQNIFIALIATLIELISTYLMIIHIYSGGKAAEEYSRKERSLSATITPLQELSITDVSVDIKKIDAHEKTNIAENNKAEIYPKNFLEKYEKVLDNVNKNIYPKKITKIMEHEKIGYSLAKLIVDKLNLERVVQKF